jgi:hypothetical protein
MSIIVAGREVKLNDALYHIAFRAWGTVTGFDDGSAILTLQGANNQTRNLYFLTGGIVNGNRVIYWHEPIALDLPFQDIGKYQAVLDTLVREFPS